MKIKFKHYFLNDKDKTKIIYFDFPCNFLNKGETRRIRIMLPKNYSKENEYKVMYLLDGQNLFSDLTCAFGSWYLERAIKDDVYLKNNIIFVGIDSPKEGIREAELCPFEVDKKEDIKQDEKTYGDIFSLVLIKKIIPFINSNFLPSQENVISGIGGSSMGGLMAFYLKAKYKDIFSFGLIFSPAFFLYTKKSLNNKFLNLLSKDDLGSYFFFVGGMDFEKIFIEDTFYIYDKMKQHMPFNDIQLIFDSSKGHNEKAWNEYFLKAIEHFKY